MSRILSLENMVIDSQCFEMGCGDKNYFETLKEIKNNDLNINLRDEELNSLCADSDYSTMFMTF